MQLKTGLKALPLLAILGLAAAALFTFLPGGSHRRSPGRIAHACPKGTVRALDAGEDADKGREPGVISSGDLKCESQFKPESFGDLARGGGLLASRQSAPFTSVQPGAYDAAVSQKSTMAATGGSWSPYGTGSETMDNTDFDQSNGSTAEGLGTASGRISDYAYDPVHKILYAAASNGGVWKTANMGQSWTSAGDGLPTQVVSAVAWSPAKGGTLLVLTGDDAFGFSSLAGMGLYRSIDDGQTWTNVKLPTGDGVASGQPNCTGDSSIAKGCFLANQVTDVVVQGVPKTGISGKAGAVLAAVGWRAGQKTDADGTVQSPNNGLYQSDTGAPGTFKKVAPNVGGSDHGFSTQKETGRIALGIADGPSQDHKIVYALVEDAEKFNGGVTGIDVEGPTGVPYPTVFKGVYVSRDFGKTWTEMEDSLALSADVTSGSALVGGVCASQSYCPGVQAWYNEWVKPDPTTQDATGVPSRIAFGLEEIWEGSGAAPLVPGTSKFHTIGRYFGGTSCAFLNTGLPVCPTNNPPQASTTTHPDQHGSIFVPDGKGGVTLVVGNDGGAFLQHANAGQDFDNTRWGRGINTNLHTLQPYDAEMAKDGTVYAGLQDNGELKIQPDQKQFEVYGGDGFFTAVDPDNSNIAYEEYTAGAISVTKDGGKNWQSMDPQLTSPQFSNPFTMDPTDAKHLLTGGRDIEETTEGPDTVTCVDPACALIETHWQKVFDLGTQKHPGDAGASSADDDPDNQTSAVDTNGDNAYVGYCGFCDVITQGVPFANGLATNVAGSAPPKKGTPAGWHIAAAKGLPVRYITGVEIDPSNPKTVYVTLAGYGRHWAPPGAIKDDVSRVGTGHVFKSTDAGQTFTDISGNLPDVPANTIVLRGNQLVVGTDIGTFVSSNTSGVSWSVLGKGLPSVPVSHLALKPGDANTLVAATYGRGVYLYRFK